jgi:hypothetical protein
MAKFKCRHCGVIIKRDLRLNRKKHFLTKSGRYKSYCENKNKYTFMERVKE